MKLRTIYESAVAKGIKEDQRAKRLIDGDMADARRAYRKAKGIEKTAFDKESFKNPYADSRILNGSGDEDIKTVLVGIDIGVPELLLADRLRGKGTKIDLVISHHPSGRGLSGLHKVMAIQSGLWEKYGLSAEVAEGLMKERIKEVSRGVAPGNNARATDAAKLLGIPFMCTHTVADNCVASYLQKMLDKKKPKKIQNLMVILKSIPEYRTAICEGSGPFILIGEEKSDAGKVFVDMTGGTSGPDKIFGRLSQSGVKTIVGMHCKESGFKMASSEFINYVIAGHISSDNLGMNLLFDHVEKKGKLKFIECSGFRRYRRK
ncbi:MAG: NGG1p interacting factor NIF3 [Candidatus Tantalella remota]|nr:NGG1p interacting factor NIF3 [Candidatus Tantalella remota]